jgi:hypothetical protein
MHSRASESPAMKTPYTGGGASCGQRYECTAERRAMFQCHCRDCQRTSGCLGSEIHWTRPTRFCVSISPRVRAPFLTKTCCCDPYHPWWGSGGRAVWRAVGKKDLVHPLVHSTVHGLSTTPFAPLASRRLQGLRRRFG